MFYLLKRKEIPPKSGKPQTTENGGVLSIGSERYPALFLLDLGENQ